MGRAAHLRSMLLLGCLAPAFVSAAPAPNPSPRTPVVLPAGIADAAGKTGFFAGAGGTVDAIDLATGRLLWQTHEAQRPLVVDGDHLLAQAGTRRNRLRVLRLDLARKGECDLESDPVVFPAWVVTGEAHGRSFTAHWRLEKHQLILDWEASAWWTGKGRPTSEQEAAARKHADGIALIDLRTGQVEMRPATRSSAPPPPALPEHLEQKAVRWQGLVGGQWKVLALEESEGRQQFVLHSWDRQSEKPLPSRELLRGKRLLARVTLDERLLCLREASPGPEEKGSLTPKKAAAWWWLFSTETGMPVGRVPDEPGMQSLVLADGKAFYLVPGILRGPLDQPNLQPRTLKAVDLKTGRKLWEHPVAGKLLTPSPL